MRKILLMMAFLLPLTFAFTGCSDDDEKELTELTSEDMKRLQGTWDVERVTGISLPAEVRVVIEGNSLSLMTKNSGNEYEVMEKYTFTHESATLSLTSVYTGKLEARARVLSLSDSEGTVEVENFEYGTYTLYLKKR